jgi:trk system potassium uptake protein TrkA
LALGLVRRNIPVLAVDASSKLVQALAPRIPHVVVADATDPETLANLGVADFRCAVVGIGNDQEASILVTANLADLEIDEIWAKAISRQHGRILERVGAHHVVLPEHDIGERIAHVVSGELLDYVELEPGYVMAKIRPPTEIVGMPLGQTALRAKHGITVMAVKPHDGAFTYADRDTVVQYGDIIMIAGAESDVERFSRLSQHHRG